MHSFGTEVRVCDTGGIRVSETLMERGLVLGEHTHTAGQLAFLLEGEYRERLGSRERVLIPGMLNVHAPGEPHSNRFSRDDDALILLISIEPARWVRTAVEPPVRLLDDVASEMQREMRRGDEAARAALEGLAMLALSRVARMVPREPEWLADALSLVERRFAEPLSLSAVARELGVGRGALAMAFRRYRRTSVGETIRAARVRHARSLLTTNMPLAEIALAAGFHDQAHFTRVFRAATGQTPGGWRSSS